MDFRVVRFCVVQGRVNGVFCLSRVLVGDPTLYGGLM